MGSLLTSGGGAGATDGGAMVGVAPSSQTTRGSAEAVGARGASADLWVAPQPTAASRTKAKREGFTRRWYDAPRRFSHPEGAQGGGHRWRREEARRTHDRARCSPRLVVVTLAGAAVPERRGEPGGERLTLRH